MHPATQAMQPIAANTTDTRNGKTSPRLEITTPAVRISLVTVELEPVCEWWWNRKSETCKVKVLGYNLQG